MSIEPCMLQPYTFATLIVGFLMGPVGAGLFKIAQEASSVLLKPALLFNETVYPGNGKNRGQQGLPAPVERHHPTLRWLLEPSPVLSCWWFSSSGNPC